MPGGACGFGEQKAGWPLPVFVDNPGGGSPTGGWGLLGPEDPPLGLPLNALLAVGLWFFYFILGFMMGFDIVGRGIWNRLL